MSKIRVHAFTISVDGYGAGPHQNLENPLGVGGHALHEWVFVTRTFQRMMGAEGGSTGIDDEFAARGFDNVGAWILGRNMFGPIRGPWPDDSWKGHPRAPVVMKGDTTFHFVTDGIQSALRQASAAANGRDVRIGGGVETIRQYLRAGLIDEMHLAISPVLLGSGEHVFSGLDAVKLGYRCTEHVSTEKATHVVLGKRFN